MQPSAPAAQAVPSFSFELPPSADGASFAAFQQNSAATCDVGLHEGASAADFWFRTTLFQLPRAMLFMAAAASHTTRRSADHIAQGNTQIAIYAFIKGGSKMIYPDDRIVSAGPGDVLIQDFSRPHVAEQSEYEAIILMVARERVPAEFLAPSAHGALLPASGGAASLLHGMLISLFDAAARLTVAEAEAGVDAVILAARSSLDTISVGANSHFGGDLMAKALTFIDHHLADAKLTTLQLQKQLGVSRSSLYRLFEPHGGVRAVILRRRLDGCLRMLLTGKSVSQPVSKLAAKHGFVSDAQFSRAFSRQFGVTPRAFHDMVSRKDHDGLTAQAQRAGFITLQAWLDHVAAGKD